MATATATLFGWVLKRPSLPRVTCCSSSSSVQFNISFAPPKPKQNNDDDDSGGFRQLFIPWIIRGEDGKLKLQTQPPARLIHARALSDSTKKKKKQSRASKAAAHRLDNENLREPAERLSKVLAAAGVASRRRCEDLIFEGQVTVNGSLCNTPQTRVDPRKHMIYVNGRRLPKKLPPKLYFAVNKPKGYICSSGEKEIKPLLALFDDFFKTWHKSNPGLPKPRLFTVGRLDVATSGLIVVTNDGDFAQSLSHPSSMLSKEYIAAVDGVVNKKNLIAISEGTVIDGIHCTPDSVELLPKQPDVSKARLRIVVHEGRNHEVRELLKNAGLEIHSLKRVRIGGFRLPSDLGIGKYVELKRTDLKLLGWKS